jgi:putative intracellular protease/amidase
MNTASNSVRAVFDRALDLPSEHARRAYLNEVGAASPEVRHRVELLLAAHANAGAFLETPPPVVETAVESLRALVPRENSLDFLSPSDRPDSLGKLARYEVLERIGSGGFGVVLKAFDEKLQRIVAIKALHPALAASSNSRLRFVREARAAAAVNDEHVIHIYEVEESGPTPYLVMEYVDGISLEEKLRQGGPLSADEALQIGQQIAAGLAAAHAQHLVHRDIKPGNILLESATGHVKLTDFGLARAVDDSTITREGVVAGTPEYMAPEQARGKPIDHRADLFSLGSVLYAMCTGRSPFAAGGSLAVLRRICDDAPQPLRELSPRVPAALADLIARLHAKRPEDRPQSADQVRRLLARCLDSRLASAPAGGISRRSWLAAAASTIAIGGLLVGTSRLFNHTGGAPLARVAEPAGAPAISPPPPRRWQPQVLIVIPPRDFYYPEFGPVKNVLEAHGVRCRVASTKLGECLPNDKSPPIAVKADLLLTDARLADYDAIYFCGGEGCLEYAEEGRHAAEARKLIGEALAANSIVAATGIGVVVLAEADVLRDRQATCNPYGMPRGIYVRRMEARGVRYNEDAVVEDGPFLTGRAPQDVRPFTYALLKRLGIEPQPVPPAAPGD